MKKHNLLITALLLCANAVSAQWSIDSLSAPYNGLAVTQNGNKAIFASATKYETYDFASGTWTIQNMVAARANVKAATAKGRSYFAGGGFIGIYSYNFFKNVDIYDSASNAWTTTNLSNARIVGGAAAVGNKVLFAGGRQILNYSNRVDIFNVVTGTRTTAKLSQARTNMAVAVVGQKVIFAGGETGNISMGNYVSSNKVDIYDNSTGTWSTALLSGKREQITVAVIGSKALFAGGISNTSTGGHYVSVIDIYDASNNTWSTISMSEAKYALSAATAGNKVYLAGGTTANSGALTNRVEIYNSTTNTISFVTISSPRMSMAVAKTPKCIMFAGGVVTWGNVGTDRVEVLDLATNTWSVEYLSRPRLNIAAASYADKAIFAGGAEVLSSYPQYSIISNRVDIYTDPVLRSVSSTFTPTEKSFTVYPNPAKCCLITLNLKSFKDETFAIKIYNVTGVLMLSKNITNCQTENEQVDISTLNSGLYTVKIEGKNQTSSKTIVVQK